MSLSNPTAPKPEPKPKPRRQAGNKPQKTSYSSNHVPIPEDFLSGPPPADAPPVTLEKIDWSASALPENGTLYAVVLDNVLTPGECAQLIRMAEDSAAGRGAGEGEDDEDDGPWRPAMVNIGQGYEMLEPEYRNSDRIIWDQQDVVDRLWRRCRLAPGLEAQLAEVGGGSNRARGEERRWVFDRFNKRMRFLKYQQGQFFRRKFLFSSPFFLDAFTSCPVWDGVFFSPEKKKKKEREREREGGKLVTDAGHEQRTATAPTAKRARTGPSTGRTTPSSST
ncbi:hypothetical protein LX36DRAFT_662994 [Colletotrichum falcatum]|nr:hypothetical protein LX36DRAFT_662994 [Colletotrichum falcatum]